MSSYYDYLPAEIQNLPFNSKRSQLFPTNPLLVDQTINDQLDGRRADGGLFPGKMLYSRTSPFGSNVQGAALASEVYTEQVNTITTPITDGKGIYTPRMAARDFNRLPQPMDNFRFNPNPIARGLLDKPIVQAPTLDAYSVLASDPLNQQSYELEPQTLISTASDYNDTPLGPINQSLGRARRRGPFLRGVGKLAGLGALNAFGAGDDAIPADPYTPAQPQVNYRPFLGLLGLVGGGLGMYHGWNRTHSTPWTVVWTLGGAVVPLIALPIMFIQGFSQKEGR